MPNLTSVVLDGFGEGCWYFKCECGHSTCLDSTMGPEEGDMLCSRCLAKMVPPDEWPWNCDDNKPE